MAEQDRAQSDVRLPKQRLVRRKDEYDQIFRQRCSAGDGMLVVYVGRNSLATSRLGMVVSRKKVGNAVARNRWKRILREAFRHVRGQLPEGIDLVVLPQTSRPPHRLEVQQALIRLTQRAVSKRESRRRSQGGGRR